MPEANPARTGIVRSLMADASWLAADLAWERRDGADTRQWLAFTVAMNPGPEYFWINGARMLAFDLPTWEREQSPWWRAYRQRLAAHEALGWLKRGERMHPDSFALRVEMGNIALYGLGDRRLAARYYRSAAASSHPPAYAERLVHSVSVNPPETGR